MIGHAAATSSKRNGLAMKLARGVALASLGALASGAAIASTCAPGTSMFTDVPDDASYCTDALWLSNRAITLGCNVGTTYCPDDPVTRAQMALFMHRLGRTLSTAVLHKADQGSIEVPGLGFPGSACKTASIAAVGYPRVATMTGYFSGFSSAVSFVARTAGTATIGDEDQVVPVTASTAFPAGQPASAPVVGTWAIPAGSTARFGIVVANASDGPDLTMTISCDYVVRIENANGASPPY